MNKHKKCKCIKDYKVKTLIHETKQHVDIVIFNEGEELFYRYEEDVDTYFITREGYKLSKLIYYSTDIEDVDPDSFDYYFIKINN